MSKNKTDNRYDVIVIGSGIGGLTSASLLAQLAQKRVLVLERHFKLGGFTHTFSRHGYTWDVGLHYVGQMAPGTQMRQVFDFITNNGVKWHKMPSIFERFVYPNLTFGVPDDRIQFEKALIQQFPAEEKGIRRYFKDIEKVNGWLTRHFMGKLFPKLIAQLLTAPQRALALQTTQTYLDRHFSDAQLKALLASQWGDYGLPPSQSAFAIHAQIVGHYLDGGYYPEGTAETIVDSIKPIIEAAGGNLMVNQEVTEIILEGNTAVGVKTKARPGKSAGVFYAPLIISDAGAYTTYGRLLPQSLNLPQQNDIQTTRHGMSTVSVYLGFKESPAKLGFTGENHWLFTDCDHEAAYAGRNRVLDGQAALAYLSFGSLRDPLAKKHTAQIITHVDYDSFSAWRDMAWKHHGEDYEALKETIATALIDLVEKHYPGFRQLIAYQEVSTPLTVENFTGHQAGAIYGIPATPERFEQGWFGIRTPVKGLLLTGADVVSLGIVGAMMGGVMTTASVLGMRGFFQIMGAAQQYGHNNRDMYATPSEASAVSQI